MMSFSVMGRFWLEKFKIGLFARPIPTESSIAISVELILRFSGDPDPDLDLGLPSSPKIPESSLNLETTVWGGLLLLFRRGS